VPEPVAADVEPAGARRLGPNDRQEHGTPGRKVTHLAHNESCAPCGTDRPPPDHYPTEEAA